MSFLSGIALLLLTMVGYAAGAASVSGKRQPVPFLLDLPLLCALWAGAFVLKSELGLGRWPAIGAGFGIAFAVSVAVTLLRRSALPPSARQRPPAAFPVPNAWRRLLASWRRFSRRMGNYQGRLILAFFYFTVVLPFGLLVSLLADPLCLRRKPEWHRRPAGPVDVDQAKLQF